MTRRRPVMALGAGLVLAAGVVLAQQPTRIPRIGFLMTRRRAADFKSDFYGGFERKFVENGLVDGKTAVFVWRFADNRVENLDALAEDLVRQGVDVIVTDGTPPTIAAQKATRTIPIVFTSAGDPVGNGLVASLAHPGGNTTGIASFGGDLPEGTKQLEFLRALVPHLSRIAVFCNATNPYAESALKSIQTLGAASHVEIVPIWVRTEEELPRAFERVVAVGAFLLVRDPFWFDQRRRIAELGVKDRLPWVGTTRIAVEDGGLMSYGPDPFYMATRAAAYVDKILKGEKPGDIPVDQPQTLELVINKKTARALGLTIPPELLVQADKVIE